MTSRNSLVKLIKHNIFSRLWSLIIIVMVYIMLLPVRTLGKIGYFSNYFGKRTIEVLREYAMGGVFNGGNEYNIIAVAVAALILGVSSFCYLGSRKKVDLYHSMPISSNKHFCVRYFSGLFIYVVALIINVLITAIIVKTKIVFNTVVLSSMIKYIAVSIVYFLLMYNMVCIATIITGNLFCNIAMSLLFLFGELVYGSLLDILRVMFFETYTGYEKSRFFISPLVDYLYRIMDSSDTFYSSLLGKGGAIIWFLASVIFFFFAAMIVYGRRKSETAGKAITFGWMEFPIKAYIVLAASLIGALIFVDMFYTNSFGWFLFGLALAFIITNLVIEMVFRSDFRQCFKHMWHWGAEAAIVAMVCSVFFFDLFGYDEYVPNKDKVEYMSVYIDGNNNYMQWYTTVLYGEYADPDVGYYTEIEYEDGIETFLDGMKLYDIDAAYELAECCVEYTKKNREKTGVIPYFSDGYYCEGLYTMTTDEYVEKLQEIIVDREEAIDKTLYTWVYVKYGLENGTEVYRAYLIDYECAEELRDVCAEVFETQEYKEMQYPIITLEDITDQFVSIYVDSICEYTEKAPSKETIEEFVEIYSQDLMELTYDEVCNGRVLGTFNIYYKVAEHDGAYSIDWIGAYPIYSSFTDSIECLEDMGFVLDYKNPDIEIISLSVESNIYIDADEDMYGFFSYVDYYPWDKEIVEALLDSVTLDSYYNPYFAINLCVQNAETGDVYYIYLGLDPKSVPNQVLQDLMIETQNWSEYEDYEGYYYY